MWPLDVSRSIVPPWENQVPPGPAVTPNGVSLPGGGMMVLTAVQPAAETAAAGTTCSTGRMASAAAAPSAVVHARRGVAGFIAAPLVEAVGSAVAATGRLLLQREGVERCGV